MRNAHRRSAVALGPAKARKSRQTLPVGIPGKTWGNLGTLDSVTLDESLDPIHGLKGHFRMLAAQSLTESFLEHPKLWSIHQHH